LPPVPAADEILWEAARRAVEQLLAVEPVTAPLAARFAEAGHDLFLVGGSVRDALLGRLSADLDFATDARPDDILRLVGGIGPTWTTGIEFGTVGVLVRTPDAAAGPTEHR
jgi:poly(A) polymerase